jgi:NADPH:quinone reductase-like Zn-dependent oxidoreductase
MMTMLAAGDVRAETAAEYDLADVQRALEHVSRSGRNGKVLLIG